MLYLTLKNNIEKIIATAFALSILIGIGLFASVNSISAHYPHGACDNPPSTHGGYDYLDTIWFEHEWAGAKLWWRGPGDGVLVRYPTGSDTLPSGTYRFLLVATEETTDPQTGEIWGFYIKHSNGSAYTYKTNDVPGAGAYTYSRGPHNIPSGYTASVFEARYAGPAAPNSVFAPCAIVYRQNQPPHVDIKALDWQGDLNYKDGVTLNHDDSHHLRWVVSGGPANWCAAYVNWTGSKGSSPGTHYGIEGVKPPGPYAYRIDCSGPGGSHSDTANIMVSNPPPASLSVWTTTPGTASTPRPYGGTATLHWSATNVSSCWRTGGSSGWPVGSSASTGSWTSGALTGYTKYTYTVTCDPLLTTQSNITRSVDIWVDYPPPTLSLNAHPDPVLRGSSVNVDWTVKYAHTCKAAGDWTGNKPFSDGFHREVIAEVWPPPSDPPTRTYTLVCYGNSKLVPSVTRSDTIRVFTPPPTITMTIDPTQVYWGESVGIEWSTTDATTCRALRDWSGNKDVNGSEAVGPLTTSDPDMDSEKKFFKLECSGRGGTADDEVEATVLNPDPIVSLNADPGNVLRGESSRVSWATEYTSTCEWSGDKTGGFSTEYFGDGGFFDTDPLLSEKTYVLTCTGPSGKQSSDSVTILVESEDPIVSLMADPLAIPYGGDTTLSWEVDNAVSCEAFLDVGDGNWTGPKAAATGRHNEVMDDLTPPSPDDTSREFGIRCVGFEDQVVEDTVTVNIDPAPPAGVVLTADPSEVDPLGSSTLTWETFNTTECEASGDWSGDKSPDGSSQLMENIDHDSTYVITCLGVDGTPVNDDATVIVRGLNPTVDLIIEHPEGGQVLEGNTATLSWTGEDLDTCETGVGPWIDPGARAIEAPPEGEETPALFESVTMSIVCRSSDGQVVEDSETIAVLPLPVVNLYADPGSVSPGGTVMLRWISNDTTECNATGPGWTSEGGRPLEGGPEESSPISEMTIISMRCEGAMGSFDVDEVLILIDEPAVSITADPISVSEGGTTVVTWSAVNVESCTAIGPGWNPAGDKALSGEEVSKPLSEATTFTIECVDGVGDVVTDSVEVTITTGPMPPVVDLIIDPSDVTRGGTTHLSWNVTGAASCEAIAGTASWTGARDPEDSTGEDSDPITDPTTFTLRCTSAEGLTGEDSETVGIIDQALSVTLELNDGGGYSPEDYSALAPILDLDLRATVATDAPSVPMTYRFYCTIGAAAPDATNVAVTETEVEHLGLCDYDARGSYTARVEVEQAGVTAEDMITIEALSSCTASISYEPTRHESRVVVKNTAPETSDTRFVAFDAISALSSLFRP